jgi:hypothetical protein
MANARLLHRLNLVTIDVNCHRPLYRIDRDDQRPTATEAFEDPFDTVETSPSNAHPLTYAQIRIRLARNVMRKGGLEVFNLLCWDRPGMTFNADETDDSRSLQNAKAISFGADPYKHIPRK